MSEPITAAGQLLDLLWPGTTLNRSEWRDRILAIEAEAREGGFNDAIKRSLEAIRRNPPASKRSAR